MFAKLKGKVDSIFSDSIILDISGVGYEIFLPNRLLANINLNDFLSLHIYSHIREDQFTLYGFKNLEDKEMLIELTKISGIGVKTALAILGLFNAEQIKQAITFADIKSLTQVPGIGKKAAERIVNELKDKLSKGLNLTQNTPQISSTSFSGSGNEPNLLNDAISALENLGYQRMQIIDIVKKISEDKNLTLEQIITKSLQNISNK